MSALTFYDVPDSLEKEIDDLETLIASYSAGSESPTVLKVHRVPFGVYEQRKDNTFMVRIRCTAGGITPKQMAVVVELAEKYGRDSIHLTTRQEIQIHDVALANVIPIIKALLKVGLSSRGGGGNTVRNIMASWDAGIAHDEVFDVTPYAVALSSHLIDEPDSWSLPRKYKIAFSNSDADNANAAFNDLGFVAKIKDGRKGFKVYVAGGMGTLPETGKLLYDFVPTDQIYVIAEAVKHLFSKHGNRKNKHRARLRFLWKKLGREKFISLLEEEIASLEKSDIQPPEISEIDNMAHTEIPVEPIEIESSGFDMWRGRYVTEQKQAGLYSVMFPIFLGDLALEHAKILADLLSNFGENVIRLTMKQNISIRNIPAEYLGNVYQTIEGISERSKNPAFISSVVACTGAETCRLGICRPHGAVAAVDRKLRKSGIDLDRVSDVRFHISGCPNTCGQHLIADLGFFGKVSRKDQAMYPAYNVVAGAVTGNEHYRFARKIDEISARDLPNFVSDILSLYSQKRDSYNSFAEYVDDRGEKDIKSLCDKYRDVPDFEDDKNYFYDWGSEDRFSLVGRGVGECSAGLFDLIDVDRNRIQGYRKTLESATDTSTISDTLYLMVLSSARMLLVTRGVEAASDEIVFDTFREQFVGKSLIDGKFTDLIDLAKRKQLQSLADEKGLILELADAVEQLYEKMDDSLTFASETETPADGDESTPVEVVEEPSLFKDYRGVPCPMNFVKVKMNLAMMSPGDTLKILLDDGEPIENVPRSVAGEGHDVLAQEKDGDHWSVLIRKKA